MPNGIEPEPRYGLFEHLTGAEDAPHIAAHPLGAALRLYFVGEVPLAYIRNHFPTLSERGVRQIAKMKTYFDSLSPRKQIDYCMDVKSIIELWGEGEMSKKRGYNILANEDDPEPVAERRIEPAG